MPSHDLVGGIPSPCLSCGGKDTFIDQPDAELDPVFVVDLKQGDGDATDRCAADQEWPLPAEVRGPFLTAGIEKRRELAGRQVTSANTCTFE